MELRCKRLILRPWRSGDEDALVRYSNNRQIASQLRDRFPHPYLREHALAWVKLVEAHVGPPHDFAAVLDGEAIGAVGLTRFDDVYRVGAEIGYWIAEPFWGRGFAPEAVERLVAYAFDELGLERLEARVFESNSRSVRVLETVGFRKVARLERSVIKDGALMASLLYERIRPQA